jgi:ATP-dependent helicase/nuclease subunit A
MGRSKRPAVDDESRRRIRAELRANLLVEAGAGSGKTQMLAERMAAGVAEGEYDIRHMAAVTFTRKAASELRGRFHLALEGRLAAIEDAPDRQQAERLHAALGNLERFFAGTIHSFCARLLRERPVESGVSPGFAELDEVQDEEVRGRAWRDFISSTRAAGDPDMLALLDAGVRPQDLDSAFATVCLNEDVEFPPGDAGCPDPKPAWEATQKFWAKLVALLPASIDPGTTCGLQQAAREFQRKLRVARRRLDRTAVVADLLDEWDRESKIVQKWWADTAAEKTRLRDLIEPLHERFRVETVTPFMGAWRQHVYRLSVTLLARARDHAARERHRLDSLNYGDLLILTARVLRGNPQVRRALQQKYRFLFVDEFQDTDPIQAEIVFLLAAEEGASEADWRKVSLRPGALFVVGDPKQSIYRFRRADIEIYNTVRQRFADPGVGRIVTLTTNFRSVPALCAWANTVFDGPFPTEPTRHSPRFAPLDPCPGGAAGDPAGVFTLTYSCERKDVPAEDADRIARYIRSEIDAGRRRYSDFLILTRRKKDRIAPYAAALEDANIPVEVSGAGAFGESAEVEALTTLLCALADPQDPLPLVAVLRGPLFGLSDPELFEFRQAGGWLSIFYEPRATPMAPFRAGHDAVAQALAALRQHHRWTRVLPAGAALDRILEDTGYLALASTTPGGVEAGDLLHALDRVRQVVEEGGSLADAADALESDGEFTSEVESLPLEPGRTDVVRLMNLHKAKGLEADVVFLADPAGGVRLRVDVHVERSGDRALGWFKVEKKSDTSRAQKLLGEHADWERHRAAEMPYLAAEETRLLYVAATRARRMLVVSRHAQTGPSAWGLLADALRGVPELRVPATVRVRVPAPPSCDAKARQDAEAARLSADARVRAPSWSIESVTVEAKRLARATARPEEVAADDATRVVGQDTASHRADVGMAWGTLIHGLLEHAMRHAHATREDLRRLAMWLTVEAPQLRTVIDQALDTVEGVMRAEFWTAARSSAHAEEVPFAVSESPGQLSTGVVDLMYRPTGAWSILDYKTDAAPDAAAQAAYAQQLAKYRRALEACGLTVGSAEVRPVRGGST